MSDATEPAREWRNELQASVCDVVEPWAHGKVLRASGYPSYWDFNVVRVEDDPGMTATELEAFADEALAGLEHRRVDFDDAKAAARVRPQLEEMGWHTTALVWMRHDEPLPPGEGAEVEEVPYDAVIELRKAWHRTDYGGVMDPSDWLANAREVAATRRVQVIAVTREGDPVGFAQIERSSDGAEITQVYVLPEHRGDGLGTAMTAAAVELASDAGDLWIVADAEDRPRELYARLGFRPVWESVEFTRMPKSS
jgi:ribosomal protein S18 acetylase RimI-like enzyme